MADSLIRMQFETNDRMQSETNLEKLPTQAQCSYQSVWYKIERRVCKLRSFFHKLFTKHVFFVVGYATLASPWKPFFAFRLLFLDHFSLQLRNAKKSPPKVTYFVFVQSRPSCRFPFTVTTTKTVPNGKKKNEKININELSSKRVAKKVARKRVNNNRFNKR